MVCPWWLCYSFDNPLRRMFHDPERLLGPYVRGGMTIDDTADFALAFWMAHEIRDQSRFLREILSILKPGGRFLLAEPKIHVSRSSVERTVSVCLEAGFRLLDEPRVSPSRAYLLGSG